MKQALGLHRENHEYPREPEGSRSVDAAGPRSFTLAGGALDFDRRAERFAR